MANTIQKKIKFSKGQIVPELVERTDLELFDSSAQVMKNVVSSVYGGVRSRRGTKKVDRILSGFTDVTGTATSGMGGNASYIQDRNNRFITNRIGSNRNFFTLQYATEQTDVLLKVRGIKIDFETPDIRGNVASATGSYFLPGGRIGSIQKYSYYYYSGTSIARQGVGLTSADRLYPNPKTGWTYPIAKGRTATDTPSFTINRDSKGSVTSVTINSGGKRETGAPSAFLIFERNSTPRAYSASVYTSVDGEEWTYVQSKVISETPQDFDFYLPSNFYYVKMDLDPVNDDIATTMSMQYATSSVGTDSNDKIKLVDFVYNATENYVLVITSEHIDVYDGEECVAVVYASGMDSSVLDDLKWTYKDDTIIFTHQDMPPKILKHLSDGSWSFGDLSLVDIPYTVFGSETTVSKSVGITPSAEEGAIKLTADSNVFDSGYVGQIIDGNGGRFKVTEYISGTVVNGYTTIPFYTKDKITSWKYISGYKPVWGLENPADPTSTNHGYPRTCLFAQQRLWFGGSREKPSTVWASRIGDYFNFKNSGNYDNDSIDVDLLTNDVIVNMVDNRGIHIFTTGQEITAKEGSYTPDEIAFVTNTQNGSVSNIRPVVLSGTVCFIEKNRKSLLSYVYSYDQASYMTDNMSLFTNLVQNPVAMSAEINSSKDKGDFVYLVLEDGTMLVGCVSIPQNIMSLSQFVTEGEVKDVCSVGGDTYIVVDRGNYNYLEKIESRLTDATTNISVYPKTPRLIYGWKDEEENVVYTYSDEPSVGDAIIDVYLDETGDAVSATGEGSITVGDTTYTRTDDSNDTMSIMYIQVLSDYNGKRVFLYDEEGHVYLDTIVSDGRIYPVMPINKNCYVGLAYQYEIVGNPIAINNKTNAIKKRITTAEITCENTPRLTFCGQEKDGKNVYKFYSCTKYDNDVRYRIDGEFYPIHILSVQLNINYEG